jgi:tetraacyldisaccharide 4'-kinase
MGESWEQYGHRVMNGQATGVVAGALRTGLRIAEPFYASLMRARNGMYASGAFGARRLPRPTISVGNITAGGTGKTPFVLWLANRLRDQGHRPAILMRGYKSAGGISDEQRMLETHLNDGAAVPISAYANPSRIAAAQQAVGENPQIDVFILDDAFQHRKVARDLDIVLINAACPFGYRHVIPRGLLREPLCGLARAQAIVLTHSDETSDLSVLEREIREFAPAAPIFHAQHALVGLRGPAPRSETISVDELRHRRFFAVSGIGHPESLFQRLRQFGAGFVGHHWFGDHHAYTSDDLKDIRNQARAAGADWIVVTEKDWAKIERLEGADADDPGIYRLRMEMQFAAEDDERMLGLARKALNDRTATSPASS